MHTSSTLNAGLVHTIFTVSELFRTCSALSLNLLKEINVMCYIRRISMQYLIMTGK